jgi:hypothetical protein
MPGESATNEVLLERVNTLCLKVDRVLMYLEGGGAAGDLGLKVRVDRLEQSESRRTWAFRALAVAVFGLVADFVMGFLKR